VVVIRAAATTETISYILCSVLCITVLTIIIWMCCWHILYNFLCNVGRWLFPIKCEDSGWCHWGKKVTVTRGGFFFLVMFLAHFSAFWQPLFICIYHSLFSIPWETFDVSLCIFCKNLHILLYVVLPTLFLLFSHLICCLSSVLWRS